MARPSQLAACPLMPTNCSVEMLAAMSENPISYHERPRPAILPCRKPSEDPVGRPVDGRRPAPAGLHDTGGRADGAGTASTRRPCAPVPGGRPGCLHVVPSSELTRMG